MVASVIARKETKYIVIHALMDPADDPTLHELQWRDRRFGYLDARFHYLIRRDGQVLKARDERTIGMGSRPHNSTSVSVLLGTAPPFSDVQLESLAGVVGRLSCLYPGAAVVGYRDLPGADARKGSPGFDVSAWDVGRRASLGL